MMWPSVKRSDPDKGFTVCRNLHSAALVDGDVVELLVTGDVPPTGYTMNPGVDVKQCAAVSATVVGVVSNPQGGSCAVGDYCLVQVYGYHPNVKTTAAALAVDTIVTGNAAGAMVAASVAALGNIVDQRCGVCIVTGAANRAGIFILRMGCA